jgi:hypothetical protein
MNVKGSCLFPINLLLTLYYIILVNDTDELNQSQFVHQHQLPLD